MRTNVTLKLDTDLLREARVIAAEEGRSLSALVTDRLESLVRERRASEPQRLGFLVGEIEVPDDFDHLRESEIAALFGTGG
jgi:hypothetical protein